MERRAELREVAAQILDLRVAMQALAERHAGTLAARRPEDRPSLSNFLHYLALRQRDLRGLQLRLERLGLSSLGRCEGHALASVDAVLGTLALLVDAPRAALDGGGLGFDDGQRALERHTSALLGPARPGRGVRIMVTLPSEAAEDPALVTALVAAGTDVVRINCAHDGVETWARMVAHVRMARAQLGASCRIAMDLAGPKLRTGPVSDTIAVRVGDHLLVTRDQAPGAPGTVDVTSATIHPARVPCLLPDALDHVAPGHRVFFDDGKHEAVVETIGPEGMLVRFVRTRSGSAEIGADKGINLPDTPLALAALTARDREDLRFAARHADMVGLSFVQRPEDLDDLDAALDGAAPELGVILKIETARAFRELPRLLLATVGRRPAGVMIARGDLAVEVGYERLAEVQEEILWLCEAAHVPVVWATQVLERLAKKGLPTRAEITDAAMSERAECVMLNKGPHVVEAVRLLDGILARMQAHQRKKAALLRPLSVASAL